MPGKHFSVIRFFSVIGFVIFNKMLFISLVYIFMVFFKLLPLFSFSFVFDTATFSEQFYKASLPLLQCLIRLACSPREW